MIDVNITNLDDHVTELHRILGEPFMKEIHAVSTLGMSWGQVAVAEASAHPFAHWWKALSQDLATSKNQGTLQLSPQSVRALSLLSDLKDIENVGNSQRILDALRSKGTFFSAAFEAATVARYVSLGHTVEVVEESTDSGVRTTDLVVKTTDGPVYVECKSLEDVSLKESKHWDSVIRRISKALYHGKRNWLVRVLSSKQIDGNEAESLIGSVTRDIRQNDMARKEILDGRVALEYIQLAQRDEEFPGSFGISRMSPLGSFSFEGLTKQGMVQYSRNPHGVAVHPYIEKDVSKRLISEFKKATSQIPKEGPGIIHIAIPVTDGTNLLQTIDTSNRALHQKLNKDTERVNVIVLCADILQADIRPMVHWELLIPNYKTRTSLPSGFTIPGSHDQGFGEIPDREGTIGFWFTPTEPLRTGIPATILYHTSLEGRSQVRIWVTWDGNLRLDLMVPSLGRVFVEGTAVSMNPSCSYHFAARWSTEEVDLWFNGAKHCSKRLIVKN